MAECKAWKGSNIDSFSFIAQFVTNDIVKSAGRLVIGGLDAASVLAQLNYVRPALKILSFIWPLKVQSLESRLFGLFSHSSLFSPVGSSDFLTEPPESKSLRFTGPHWGQPTHGDGDTNGDAHPAAPNDTDTDDDNDDGGDIDDVENEELGHFERQSWHEGVDDRDGLLLVNLPSSPKRFHLADLVVAAKVPSFFIIWT